MEEENLPRELLIEADDEQKKSYPPSPTVVTQVIENVPRSKLCCFSTSKTYAGIYNA